MEGLAQPTALDVSELAHPLCFPELSTMQHAPLSHGHGRTDSADRGAPNGQRGLGPWRCMCRPTCIPSSLNPARGQDSAFLHVGVCALEGGYSIWLLFVYMQIFVIKTIS